MGEECGCSRGHARENGACPKLQARSARKQEGVFCISAEMRTSTDFPPYISSISIFWHFRPRTSILVVVTFFSGCDCFYGGVVLTTSTAQYRYRFTYLLSISKKVVSAGVSEIFFCFFLPRTQFPTTYFSCFNYEIHLSQPESQSEPLRCHQGENN